MTEPTATSVQPLLEYFNRLIPLNQEERELVRSKFHAHLFTFFSKNNLFCNGVAMKASFSYLSINFRTQSVKT